MWQYYIWTVPVLQIEELYYKCDSTTSLQLSAAGGRKWNVPQKKQLIWCRSFYISMKLANNRMLDCMFVTYTDICKHIMFTV